MIARRFNRSFVSFAFILTSCRPRRARARSGYVDEQLDQSEGERLLFVLGKFRRRSIEQRQIQLRAGGLRMGFHACPPATVISPKPYRRRKISASWSGGHGAR